jgi:hypothetical protein
VIETVTVGVMLAAAYLAYGSPAGVLEALGGGDEGAWGAVRALALHVSIPLAAGTAIVRWTGDEA